jgi:hypothetical protein
MEGVLRTRATLENHCIIARHYSGLGKHGRAALVRDGNQRHRARFFPASDFERQCQPMPGPPVVITFNIPGAALVARTISPSSPLPAITRPVILDGYSQPGTRPNNSPNGDDDALLLIELRGDQAGDDNPGLKLMTTNCVIRGLAINRFAQGLQLANGGGHFITGNFIGTDALRLAHPGHREGIHIENSARNTIGARTWPTAILSQTI